MRSSDYWQERFTKIAEQNDSRAESAAASVTRAFEKATAELQAEIDAWYQRFADNNGISLADAKKLLTARELQELKWDVAEYIRRGEENALDQRWMKELENASARFHISRLEALQLRTRQAAEKAYGQERSTMEKLLRETYAEDYYHSAFEIQKGMGIGFRVDAIDDGRLQKLLKKPWTADGSTFSDRIWKSKAQLLSTVETELTRMCLTGDKPDRAIQAISKAMNVSKAQAGRLVMTESAYFATAAQHDCFKELDVEQYEICCALDEKTCEICGKMDLRHFPMNDFKPGLTAPPFHPNCRCAHAPFFDDEWDYEGTRAARGKDGKTYQVPAGMSYEEWKGKQDSRPGEGYIDRARKVAYNTSQDKEQYQRYRDVLGDWAPKSFREFQELKYAEDGSAYGKLKHNYRVINAYEDNAGKMAREKIVELHDRTVEAKLNFTGAAKKTANTAVMELDGKVFISNSKLTDSSRAAFQNFGGDKTALVCKPKTERFQAFQVGSHVRDGDSEKNLLEYAATIADDGKKHTINLLSERCMCESCRGVLEQFRNAFPNVRVNAVSNKAERVAKNKNNPMGWMTKGRKR